ncbi:MAG TPA: alpha/beta fold hydrolase [Actinomycetota bacterium]|nr:alpha/beta fold hydrolase [Actinomycetota bacterium]
MAEVHQVKLGYDESGQGEVLLLVHGFPVDRRIWAHQVSGLSDVRRVVAVDLRGRGKSPASTEGGWTMETHAGDLAETIESLGVDQVDLGGISMGGYIAFAFYRKYPQMVRSLILISTRAVADPPEYKTGRVTTAERARRFGTRALAGSMLPNLLAEGAPQEVQDEVVAMFDAIPGDTSAEDSLAMKDRPDSTPMLSSITVPTLVIEGAGEQLLPAGTARALADAIPGARMVSIPNAGHFAPVENPDGVNGAIRGFLT